MIKATLRSLHQAMLSLVLRIPPGVANRLIRWRFPTVQQRSAGSLLFAHDRVTRTFIDVRGRTLRQVGEQIDAGRRCRPHAGVALVCEVGYCSSRMAAELTEAGFDGVVNLEGGLRALRLLRHDIELHAAQRTA